MAIVEFFIYFLESIIVLISPEKTADKVNDIDTSKTVKVILTITFTLIYGAVLAGLIYSLLFFMMDDILLRAFVVGLVMFLIYCLFTFYSRILSR